MRRWRGLEESFPGLIKAMALLSCEEAVEDVRGYVEGGEPVTPEAEKEHVMVGVQVRVDGRAGLLLADPGYHVARVVTVMQDQAYPHTGWFTQSDDQFLKEYSYAFSPHSADYVEWRERTTRDGAVKRQTSLVFVARPFLDGVNVTERRNLVYNFRSLLSRDQKGHLTAGLYFPVGARGREATFTLFLGSGADKRKTKHKFSQFLDGGEIPQSLSEDIELCNRQMNYKEGELLEIISKLARVVTHQPFIDQMLEINEDICRISL